MASAASAHARAFSSFERIFNARMPACDRRASAIIVAAILLPRDQFNSSSYSFGDKIGHEHKHVSFRRAVTALSRFEPVADEMLELILDRADLTVDQCFALPYPHQVHGVQLFDENDPKVVAAMVDRMNEVRSDCPFYDQDVLNGRSLTADDLPPSLYAIPRPTWRHLHIVARFCSYLMIERFDQVCLSLTITGDVVTMTTVPWSKARVR
jgi:hypothetical protein